MPEESSIQAGGSESQVASPFATGGGGTIFENKIQASLFAVLLVHGHLPFFDNAQLEELHLQTERLDYKTDDALAVGLSPNGKRQRQLWSMKHDVTFAPSDTVFQNVISDAWADFNNARVFDQNIDSIVLATGTLAAKAKHFLTLLGSARAATSGEDFEARVARVGFLSGHARSYLATCQKNADSAAGRALLPHELWKFLRCFHVISFDFDQDTSLNEAHLKTLLALAVRPESGRTGADIWNSIFNWVAKMNPRGGSFTRASLPSEWQLASTSIGAQFESGVINRLLEHSKDLLQRIRTHIGPRNVHLDRRALVESLGLMFARRRFTLVAGPAGVGKSAAAYEGLTQVLGGAPLFVFQAAEFAHDNLDNAFAELRINEPLSRISALFSLHPEKYILIESVERLLEAPEREAFFMLLKRIAEDPTWHVILTCRHHATEMVKDAFLLPLGLKCGEATVPLLSDEELEKVVEIERGLHKVANNPRTRALLKNPWFLDKACTVNWNTETINAELDLQNLRDILWRKVVVREDVRVGGIHLKREKIFQTIALRRARSLRSFVPIEAGEEEAVQSLVSDELLVQEHSTRQVAPAHDVLEDWALVRWLEESFQLHGAQPKGFFDSLGHELPIRRSYRLWLQERLAASDITKIRTFVERSILDPAVEAYWKDETSISVLLSDEAPRFLREHEMIFLAEKKTRLYRFIHLLRIACKKPNPLWRVPEGVLGKVMGDLHLIPEGKAWDALIQLINRNINVFGTEDLPQLLGFLEDWKAGINWQSPVPAAATEAGRIALHFWKIIKDDYHNKEALERLAGIFLSVPSSIPEEFEELLKSKREDAEVSRTRDYRDEILEQKLLRSFECWPACRSHPASVARYAEEKWGLDRPAPRSSAWERESSHNIADHFGLQGERTLEYFPASAYQGPFLALLQTNPAIGVALILKLSNIATERFVEFGLDSRYGQGPIEIEIELNGGVKHKQWVNVRLWQMYREGMPGPHVLNSALMALERWLLDAAKDGSDLTMYCNQLILESNSVMTTAVVASIGMAYPKSIGETALALLKTPLLFDLDTGRYVHDQRSVSSILGDSGLNGFQRAYRKERIESDKLPHRKRNLELFVCELQMGPLRDQVRAIIDAFKAELPPAPVQDEEIKWWRLRLHRMDLRNFTRQVEQPDGRIALTAGPPEADIAELVESKAPEMESTHKAMELVAWGMAVFERRDVEGFDADNWRPMLKEAQRLAKEHEMEASEDILSNEGGPGYVAAVCVRDHWHDLDMEHKKWCRDFLLSKIDAEKDATNKLFRVQRFSMASSRAAARVLPHLLDDAEEPDKVRVREGIASALTHAVDEVRHFAALAVGQYLWERDADLASACIAGMIAFANLERVRYGKWRWESFETRGEFHDAVWQDIGKIRSRIASGAPIEERRRYRLSIRDSFSSGVLPLIAGMISNQPQLSFAQAIHLQIAESFVRSWTRDGRYGKRRNYEEEAALRRQFANFLIKCPAEVAKLLWNPLLEVVGKHSEEVAEFLESLIYAEDAAQTGSAFWTVWNLTADKVTSLPNFAEKLSSDWSSLAKLGSVLLFDNIHWREDARDWKPLHGHENEIRAFFTRAGRAPQVCKSMVRFLDSVGNYLLPDALTWLDEVFAASDPSKLVGDRNSLFSLARMLTPFVFSQTDALRKSTLLRDATLRVLNALIEQGSSAAFRMREFIITPITPH